MFKKNKVAISVATGILGAMGVMTSAQAVHVNPDGTGQALLFPFYSARDGYITNVNLVNSTDQTKAVRIRINEGKTSKDVKDFNLYLSPEDVWTGTIRKSGDLGSISTNDRTCAYPAKAIASCDNGKCESTGGEFKISTYKDVSADDTLEGYVEVIEMGVVDNSKVEAGVVHVNGKPVNCGVVDDAWYRGDFKQNESADTTGKANGLTPPTGGLFGSSAILNVQKGVATAIAPVALENFTKKSFHTKPDDKVNQHWPSFASGSVTTSEILKDGGGTPQLVTTTWNTLNKDPGLSDDDAGTSAYGKNPYPVAHALLASKIMNEYFVDPSNNYDGHTDWVVTFPMKKYGIFNRSAQEKLEKRERMTAPTPAQLADPAFILANFKPLPTGIFDCVELLPGGVEAFYSPEDIGNEECIRYGDVRVAFGEDIFDREEGRINDADYSPVGALPPRILEREVNVLTFTTNDKSYDTKSTVLSSSHALSKSKPYYTGTADPDDFVDTQAFVSGWSRMGFAGDYKLSTWWPRSETGRTDMPLAQINGVPVDPKDSASLSDPFYHGVPVAGFAALEGNVSESAGTRFGDAFPHKTTRE